MKYYERMEELKKRLKEADRVIDQIVTELKREGGNKAFTAQLRVRGCTDWSEYHKAQKILKDM